MKAPIFFLLLVANLSTFAQQKTNVLVISTHEGKLLVDGTEQQWLKASEPAKLSLESGDHIIQLKTTTETNTKTISCSDGKQKVINFDDSPNIETQPKIAPADIISVADLQLELPGSLSGAHLIRKPYCFDEGDQISFDFDILNKSGTINISLSSYPDNGQIFSKDKICTINDETIKIPKRGIYYFTFSTNHVVTRSAHFVVKRKPSSGANSAFSTAVRVKYDTTFQEIMNDQVHVYSTGNIGHINRTIVRINLPAQTKYWVYWIGVDKESMEKMKQLVTQLSSAASKLTANPLCALGFRLIPSLPMFNSTATVDYRFADNANSELFFAGNPGYNYYTFKEGTNVTTDYAIEEINPKEMNLCLWNNNRITGHDVNIQVGAFIVKSSLIQEQ